MHWWWLSIRMLLRFYLHFFKSIYGNLKFRGFSFLNIEQRGFFRAFRMWCFFFRRFITELTLNMINIFLLKTTLFY